MSTSGVKTKRHLLAVEDTDLAADQGYFAGKWQASNLQQIQIFDKQSVQTRVI